MQWNILIHFMEGKVVAASFITSGCITSIVSGIWRWFLYPEDHVSMAAGHMTGGAIGQDLLIQVN